MRYERAIVILAASVLLLAARSTQAATVKLAWDPAVDGLTTGYVVSYGTSPGTYLQQVNVGLVTAFALNDLLDGTPHYFVVQAYNATGERSLISPEVTATTPPAVPGAPGLPAPPSSLTATLRDGRYIDLRWQAAAGTPSYRVDVGTAAGLSNVSSVSAGTATTATVGALPEGTYYVRVRSVTTAGVSVATNEVVVICEDVEPVAPSAPAAPRSLVATLRDGHFIDLQWQAAITGTPTYRVDVGTASGLSNVSSVSAGTATTATVGSLPTGTYYIRVRNVTTAGVSASTNEVVMICVDVPPGAPGAPVNLRATLRDWRFIDLTWQNPPEGVSSHRVEVGTAPGTTNVSSFTTGLTTRFTISDLRAGTYYIRVRRIGGAVVSAASNEVAVATIQADDAPRNLSAVIVGGTVVRLTWDQPLNATGVVGYQLEAGSGPGRAELATIPVGAQTFTTPPVGTGTYFFRVRSRKSTAPGSSSNEIGVQIGNSVACTTAPGVPSLAASAVGTSVQLSWTPGDGAAPTGYVLDVGSTPGHRDLATLLFGADLRSLSASAANGTYALRLSAVNACGSSPSPDVTLAVGGADPTAPGAPSGLTRHVVGRVVTLTWSPSVTGGESTRYVIEATDTQGNPIVTLDTGNLSTSFVHGQVPPGTYVVRVRGANAAGAGTASDAVTVIVTP